MRIDEPSCSQRGSYVAVAVALAIAALIAAAVAACTEPGGDDTAFAIVSDGGGSGSGSDAAVADARDAAPTDARDAAPTDARDAAMTDARDAALTDARIDALTDARIDALTDARPDAMMDAGSDAPRDAAPDACGTCCTDANGRTIVCPCQGLTPPTPGGNVCCGPEGCSAHRADDDGEPDPLTFDELAEDPTAEGPGMGLYCALLAQCNRCEYLKVCRPADWQCQYVEECGCGSVPACPASPLACPSFADVEKRNRRGRSFFEQIVTPNFDDRWMYLATGAATTCDVLATILPFTTCAPPVAAGVAIAAAVFSVGALVAQSTTTTNYCSCGWEYDLYGKANQTGAQENQPAFCWRWTDEAHTQKRCSTQAFPTGCAENTPNAEEISACCHDNFKSPANVVHQESNGACVVEAWPTRDDPPNIGDCLVWEELRCNNGGTPYRCGNALMCAVGPSSACYSTCQRPTQSCVGVAGPTGCYWQEKMYCPPSGPF